MARVTRASYAVLAACTLAHFMNHVYTGALSPVLPVITEDLSLTLTEAGIVTSASIVTMTIAHLAFGYLTDKGLKDIFISISVLLSAIVILFASFATTFIVLAFAMALLGLGAAPYHPASFPAMDEKFPKREMAKATGIAAAGGLVGMALIPLIGVTLLSLLGGWQPSFIVLGLLGIAFFVPTFLLMRDSNNLRFTEESETVVCEGEDRWTRYFVLTVVLSGLRGIPFRCTTLLMPLYLYESYGYEPFWAGSLTTIMLTAGLFGEIVSAPISDRAGRRIPYILISTISVTPLFLLLNLSLTPVFLILVLIGIGFFYFFAVPPFQAFMTEVCPRNTKGLAFGIFFSIGAIPGAISPIIFGYIGDMYGLSMSIAFLASITALASIVVFILRKAPSERNAAEMI